MFKQITSELVGKTHVVEFVSSRIMDPMLIEEIGSELNTLTQTHAGERFLLDLKNVDFLSSAVLNLLIVLDKKLKVGKGILAFCNLSPAVDEVFALTKLDLLFKIYDSRNSALKDLN